MADSVDNLGAHRANRTGDCRDWTVTDALREALRQVESGEVKAEMVYVAFSASVPGNKRDFVYQCAGGTKLELIGLLARHLHMTNER